MYTVSITTWVFFDRLLERKFSIQMVYRAIITAFSCFISLYVLSQDYSYTHYDSKDGLAGSTVYCAVQDKDGFLWFGTETGLSRFDGTNFKNFTTADGLPDNEILRLFVDSKNRVWILPFKNAICYYWKGKIYNQQNDSILKKLVLPNNVRSLAENKRGSILILGTEFSYLIKPDGKILAVPDRKDFLWVEVGNNDKGDFRFGIYGAEYCIRMDFDEQTNKQNVKVRQYT